MYNPKGHNSKKTFSPFVITLIFSLIMILNLRVAHAAETDLVLLDLSGKQVKVSDYKGKWVIVNYWATWCPPCAVEIPELNAFHLFDLLGVEISLGYCLLFGALISPTDPIAVLGILKKAGVPKSLETKITGESLFNDGVGVVVFLALFGIVTANQEVSGTGIALLFVEEVIGGGVMGLLLGGLAYAMLRRVDNYQVEVLITLALVMGGYSLASSLHLSGPIVMVVGGLLIGNHGRRLAMSEKTREHLDTFWELVDEVLNAVLFVLIGLEVLVLTSDMTSWLAALIMIPLVLLARFVCVAAPVSVMKLRRSFSPNAIKIMTWGGLRGGISVALALSLPLGSERDTILIATYAVVIFSILVQGLTINRLVKSI